MKKIALMGVATMFCHSALGYDLERAQANLASDYATCTAYYLIMSKGLDESGESGKQLNQLSEYSFKMAISLSNREVTSSRVRMSYKEMSSSMKGNFSNAAVIIEKHGEVCKSVLEAPEIRMEYWLNK